MLAPVTEIAKTARIASAKLARLDGDRRTAVLNKFAEVLERRASEIVQANKADCDLAAMQVEHGKLSSSLYQRLNLDEKKLRDVIEGVKQLAALDDPLGSVELARELDAGLELYRIRCPIGVVLVIFEARPDALPQIASLLIKSGNAGLLKGGSEAQKSNETIFACLDEALRACDFPEGAYRLVPGRHEVSELLAMHKYIDLVIPRGSGALVRSIQENTKIPVLGHAEGICHLYVDKGADLDMALRLAIDAKTTYPAACNSIETLLIHRDIADKFKPAVLKEFEKAGVKIDEASNWCTEYSDLMIAIKVVDSLEEAIQHINEFGSGHTDAIVTGDFAASEIFATEVNSAGVYINASTRFADGFRYGFGAEVGISTGKLHPRGPVGVDGITTYKYRLIGNGHVVSEYSGTKARKFTHKDLVIDD